MENKKMTDEKTRRTDRSFLEGALVAERSGSSAYQDIKREFSPSRLVDMYKSGIRCLMSSWEEFGLNRDFLIITNDLMRLRVMLYTHPDTKRSDIEELSLYAHIARDFIDDAVYTDRLRLRTDSIEQFAGKQKAT